MRVTVFGLSVLVAVAMVTAQDTKYMGVIPKQIRTGMDYTTDFTLTQPASQDVSIYGSIRKHAESTSDLAFENSMFTIMIAAGQTHGSHTVMAPYDLPAGEQYFVHFSFTGLQVKPLSVAVVIYRPALPLFIITDKPIYKPRQTVYIRALSCDENLKPINKNLTIKIKDSQDNLIMKEMPKADGAPLVDIDFELSDNPPTGTYKLGLYTDDGYTERTFQVEEYVLPRYEVKLELDEPFIIEGDNMISGRIQGIYSYGKKVQGSATLKMTSGYGEFNEDSIVWSESNFDGSKTFTAKVDTSKNPMPWYRDWYSPSTTMKLRAEVNEQLTENVESADASFTIYPKAFAAKMMSPMPILFQGNVDYTFEVELTNPQGGSLNDWDGEGSNGLSYYTLYYKARDDKDFSKTEVSMNPMSVTVKLNTSDTSLNSNEVEAYFEYTSGKTKISSQHVQGKVAKYYTWSKETIAVEMVYTSNKDQKCFKIVPFEAGDKAYFQIVNNYYPEQLQVYTQTAGHCFTVDPKKHAPMSKVVVYKLVDYTDGKTEGTELLVASLDVNIDWTPSQSVTVEVTSKDGEMVVKPGEDVEIVIKTNGQAYVGVKGVDKSVSFMADPNEITLKELEDAVTAFRLYGRKKENPFQNPPNFPMPLFMGRPGGPIAKRKKRCSACTDSEQYTDSRKSLEEAGLFIVTDLTMKRQEGFDTSRSDYGGDYVFLAMAPEREDALYDGNVMFRNSDGAVDEDDGSKLPEEEAEEEQIRQDFPETWLWDLEMTDINGNLKLDREVPDTITKWQVSAFGVNEQYGLSVSDTKEITVFQDFFISMNLPYSVVRSEKVKIDILVFNYLDGELQVEVEFFQSPNYTIQGTTFKKTLTIDAGSSNLASVMVEFTVIGDIPLKVKATNVGTNGSPTNKVDTVIRELIVEPEGREIREDDNVVVVVNSQNNMETTTEASFNMSEFFRTQGYVDGSLRMYLFVTGDMMGPFISNIQTRIKMPFGCGEQNIKSLTPSVFVGRYLNKIGRLDEKTKALLGKVCGAGVRKEFQYLHRDGSYSAFGDNDNVCTCGSQARKKGSTWLTAYVLMSFSLLYTDDVTFVSPENLKKSFEYIKNNATKSDCEYQYFVELGQLIHTEMQGGTGTRFGFVAFVLLSVMDYKHAALKAGFDQSVLDADNMISGASGWLESQKDELMLTRQPYQLAIVAYTLARAPSASSDATSIQLLQELEKLMQEKEENMDMEKPDMTPPEGQCIYSPSSGEQTKCRSDDDCNSGNSRYSYNNKECCQVACEAEGVKMCSNKPYQPRERMIHGDSDSSSIETKGYALLTYLELYESGRTEYKAKIEELKKWLLSKRKGNGFFSSTQDTVVALRALAKYAMTFPDSNGADYTVRTKDGNGDFVAEEVRVTSDTYTVTTERKLNVDTPPSSVSVVVSGKSGTAYINLVALYNVAKNVSRPVFNVTVEPRKVNNKPEIKACFQKDPKFFGSIGSMAVINAKSQTGFTFVHVITEDIVRPEVAPTKVEITEKDGLDIYYLDDGDFEEERCIRIAYEETTIVENRQPAVLTVMDYYVQENKVDVIYSVDPDKSEVITTTQAPILGASSVGTNLFLLVAAIILVKLAQFTSSE